MASPLISVKVRSSGQFPDLYVQTSEFDDWPNRWRRYERDSRTPKTINENFILDFRLGKEHKVRAAIAIILYQQVDPIKFHLSSPSLSKQLKLVTHSFGEYSTVKANIWYDFYDECLKLVLWSTVPLEWSKKFPLIQEIWAFLEPTCVHLLDSRKIFRLFLILTQKKPLRKSEMISTSCKVTFLE